MTDDQMMTLWLGSFRYHCGQMTYTLGLFVEMLIQHWPTLPEATKALIRRDLEEEFERDDRQRAESPTGLWMPLGHDCDRTEWERVRALWK